MRGLYRGRMLAVTLLIGSAFWLSALPAHADPHAMFYTAVGQRQLFFNVLAALDQADYVEPANQGASSREILRGNRDTANQSGTLQDAVNATKTDLSAVLTRAITLDGTDLWTNYLAFQLAKQAAQHGNTNHFAAMVCAQGLGRIFGGDNEKFCENDAPANPEAITSRKRAYNVDPQERSALAYQQSVTGILGSDTASNSAYQRYLTDIQDPQARKTDQRADFPVPFDPAIASLRETARENDPTGAKSDAVERLSATAAQTQQGGFVGNAFDCLGIDDYGNVTFLAPGDSGCSAPIGSGGNRLSSSGGTANLDGEKSLEGIHRYFGAVQSFLDLPHTFISTAARGADIANQHLASTETEGAIAPVVKKTTTDTSTCENGVCTRVPAGTTLPKLGNQVQLAAPPYVNRAQIEAGLGSLGSANANPQVAPLAPGSLPGTESLLQQASGTVAGAQTGREGRVLHATTPETQGLYNTSVDLGSGPTAPHEERAGKHFLLALTNETEEGSGCGCGLHSAINDMGQAIITRINGRSL